MSLFVGLPSILSKIYKVKNMNEILVFKMPNCAPCKMLEPVISKFENVTIVNTMEDIEKSMQYGVRKAPTVIHLIDGKEVGRFTGLKTEEEIKQFLKQ